MSDRRFTVIDCRTGLAKPALGTSSARTEMLETAVREAQQILAEHIDPRGIPAAEAINRLLLLLDHREFVKALNGGKGDLERWRADIRGPGVRH